MKQLSALFKKNSSSSKGFTLIELLVVIGILGILAASLVATIDPFEQLKKAQDANVKNVLVEFLNATVRYYETHNAYPWDSAANNGGACNSQTAPVLNPMVLSGASGVSDCVTALQGDNELKSAFSLDTGDLSKISISYNNANGADQVIGCFQPSSKSQQKDANTKYNQNGTARPNCASQGGSDATCFWCTR